MGGVCRVLDALALLFGKDAGKEPARREVLPGDARVVLDVAAELEPARHLLRVVAFDTAGGRKVGRAAEHKVEMFVPAKRCDIAKIAFADVIAAGQSVVVGRLAREP